jgi:heat shock protein HtpX
MEQLKTYALMTGLTLLFIWFGGMIAGQTGMIIAFIAAAGMNFYAYYYSDTQVLKHYHATPVDRDHATGLYEIVERLTARAELPMPALYIIPEDQPNAFATGRDYEHAAVAVTETSSIMICSSVQLPLPLPEPLQCLHNLECFLVEVEIDLTSSLQ